MPAEPARATVTAAVSKGAPKQHDTGTTTPVDTHLVATIGGCVAGTSNGAEVDGGLPAPVDGRGGSCSSSGANARVASLGAGAGASEAAERVASAAPPTGPAGAEQQGPGGARDMTASARTSACMALPEGRPREPSSSAGGSHGGTAGVLAAVRSATGCRGADVVLEAVGSQAAVRLAYELIRPGGAAPGLPVECCSLHPAWRLSMRKGRLTLLLSLLTACYVCKLGLEHAN